MTVAYYRNTLIHKHDMIDIVSMLLGINVSISHSVHQLIATCHWKRCKVQSSTIYTVKCGKYRHCETVSSLVIKSRKKAVDQKTHAM